MEGKKTVNGLATVEFIAANGKKYDIREMHLGEGLDIIQRFSSDDPAEQAEGQKLMLAACITIAGKSIGIEGLKQIGFNDYAKVSPLVFGINNLQAETSEGKPPPAVE